MLSPDADIAALRSENQRLRAHLAERDQEAHDLRQENDVMRAKLSALEHRLHAMRKRIYGWTSERHHPGQGHIDLGIPAELACDPGVSASSEGSTNVAATLQPTATPPASPLGKRPRAGRHPGRRALPADAEVVVEDVTLPENERLDEHGHPLPLLGYRSTDKWDFRVGTYLIRRHRRAIYGRPFSEAQDRIVAPAPACLVPKGKMTDAALIHTVVAKFADHLPLYRQELCAGRMGYHLSRATLVSHVAAVSAALSPIYEAIAGNVRQARYVHVDDTPIKLMDPGRGHTATARMWAYVSERETAFQFTGTREGRHVEDFLGDYRGFMVADDFSGHNRMYGPRRATAVGCWAHVRRRFYEIHEQVPFAARVLDEIRRLYVIEDELRLADDDDRRRARQARAAPLVAQLRDRLERAYATALPSNGLGGAIAHALKRYPTLVHYLEHGFLPIDNNPAENALRPWAVGRKNWLFFGSHAGGERAAIVATLIENCRRLGLDPYAYLIDTVKALHRGCTDYHALTPLVYAQNADRACA
jgi:transposase